MSGKLAGKVRVSGKVDPIYAIRQKKIILIILLLEFQIFHEYTGSEPAAFARENVCIDNYTK